MHTTIGLLLSVVMATHTYPLQEAQDQTLNIIQLQKDVNVVAYIQNFKNLMSDYVNTQYKNLTINEIEKVKATLEEFLLNFAKDLKEIVDNQGGEGTEIAKEIVGDGIPDSTFIDIKERIKTEFPNITEDTADNIVYKLRYNLFETRQKLDKIIKESEQAQIENSQ